MGRRPVNWPLSAPLLWPDAAPVNSEMLLKASWKPAFIVNKIISDIKSTVTEMYPCFSQEAPLFTAELRSAACVRACLRACVHACVRACRPASGHSLLTVMAETRANSSWFPLWRLESSCCSSRRRWRRRWGRSSAGSIVNGQKSSWVKVCLYLSLPATFSLMIPSLLRMQPLFIALISNLIGDQLRVRLAESIDTEHPTFCTCAFFSF